MRVLSPGLALAFAACAASAALAETKTPDLSAPDSWEPRPSGTVRVMNKSDSTVDTLTLKAGETVRYESLSISLTSCFVRPSDLPADAAAHLKIVDERPDTPHFDGWMLQKEPGLNMLQHPVYDVQLVGCA